MKQKRRIRSDTVMIKTTASSSPSKEQTQEHSKTLHALAGTVCDYSPSLTLSSITNTLASAAESLEKLRVLEGALRSWRDSPLFCHSPNRDKEIVHAFLTALGQQAGTVFFPKPPPPTTQRLADGLAACLEIQCAVTTYANQSADSDQLLRFGSSLYDLIACGKPLEGAHVRGIELCRELVQTNQTHKLRKLTEIMNSYACFHGLSENVAKGIRHNILPAIERGDPGSKPLWGSRLSGITLETSGVALNGSSD